MPITSPAKKVCNPWRALINEPQGAYSNIFFLYYGDEAGGACLFDDRGVPIGEPSDEDGEVLRGEKNQLRK